MLRLSENQRIEFLPLLATGVIRQMDRGTIIYLQRRYNVTGTILDHPKAGTPEVKTVGQDRQMKVKHRRRRFKT